MAWNPSKEVIPNYGRSLASSLHVCQSVCVCVYFTYLSLYISMDLTSQHFLLPFHQQTLLVSLFSTSALLLFPPNVCIYVCIYLPIYLGSRDETDSCLLYPSTPLPEPLKSTNQSIHFTMEPRIQSIDRYHHPPPHTLSLSISHNQ